MLRSSQFLKFSSFRSSRISGLQDLKPTGLAFEILGSLEEQLLDLSILRAHRKLAAMLCLRTEFVGVDDLHDVQALGQTGRSNGRRKCPQRVEAADIESCHCANGRNGPKAESAGSGLALSAFQTFDVGFTRIGHLSQDRGGS